VVHIVCLGRHPPALNYSAPTAPRSRRTGACAAVANRTSVSSTSMSKKAADRYNHTIVSPEARRADLMPVKKPKSQRSKAS